MLSSRTLQMAGRSPFHLRGSRVWRTGRRRSGPTGASLLVAKASTGRTWMKTSAWRVSWQVVDLVKHRSLFAGGSKGGNQPLDMATWGRELVQGPMNARARAIAPRNRDAE